MTTLPTHTSFFFLSLHLFQVSSSKYLSHRAFFHPVLLVALFFLLLFNERVPVLFLFLTSTSDPYPPFSFSSSLTHHPHFISPYSYTHLPLSLSPPPFSADSASYSSVQELSISFSSSPTFLLFIPFCVYGASSSSSSLRSLRAVTHPRVTCAIFPLIVHLC